MDWTTVLPSIVAAVGALLAAFLGHTAASQVLSSDMRKLMSDVQAGHTMSQVKTDLADVKQAVTDLKSVIDAAAAKPGA